MSGTKKTKWSKKDLNKFEKIIVDKRNKVIADLLEAKEKADEVLNNNSINAIYSSHMADAGSDQQEMEKNYYMMDRDNSFLQYLDRALKMIKDGTFGICSKCSTLIDKERLIEVPHTTSCFSCKTQD
tara:strand:+ start:49 stop:429 length:381 start_codon:yes stop_codon:yes gene_type:complete